MVGGRREFYSQRTTFRSGGRRSIVAESEERTGVREVKVKEVWQQLETDPKAQLIDVRTRAEWAFVGVPDLSGLGKQPVLIEWQTFPDGQINPSFVDQLISDLVASGVGQDTNLYFICRSGGRSLAAARAMAEAGFRACHNVTEGFEGPPDQNRHRGTVEGWKAADLPWVQG